MSGHDALRACRIRRLRRVLFVGLGMLVLGVGAMCVELIVVAQEWPEGEEPRVPDYVMALCTLGGLFIPPVAATMSVTALACLGWLTRWRFDLRDLLIAMFFVALLLGIVVGTWRSLSQPHFLVHYPQVLLKQRGTDWETAWLILSPYNLAPALFSLLVLPIVYWWPQSKQSGNAAAKAGPPA